MTSLHWLVHSLHSQLAGPSQGLSVCAPAGWHTPRGLICQLQDSSSWPRGSSGLVLVHLRINLFSCSTEMEASWSPSLRQKLCVCGCVYVGVYMHIHIPSQIPGPERGIGEDAAPPTCYPGKEARKERRGLPGELRKQQEVDLADLDLRHQVSQVLSTLPPLPHPFHPLKLPSSLFPGLRLSPSSTVGIDVQKSEEEVQLKEGMSSSSSD